MVYNWVVFLTQPMDPEKKSLNFIFPTNMYSDCTPQKFKV